MKHAAILLVLVSAPASAHIHDSVCAVTCPPNGGSGTLVAINPKNGHGLVIGVAHVIQGGDTSRITCKFPAAKKVCRARLLKMDRRYDIAALDIADAPEVDMPTGIVSAKKDDGEIVCAGYPWNSRGRLRWNRGKSLGFPRGGESSWLPSMFHSSNHVISGYSGGARFNRYGEYVGPISGMCGEGGNGCDRCWGASGEVLTKFVGQYVKGDK